MKITGWMFTDARLNVKCRRCSAGLGEHCHTPSGRTTRFPHNERVADVCTMAGDRANGYWSGRPIKLGPEDTLVTGDSK